MSSSFTSKGGFRLAINGVVVLRQHGKLEASWDSEQFANKLIWKFADYANKVRHVPMSLVACHQVNSPCDGDRDSYDAMVLLTGRSDFRDMKPGL